MDSRKTVWALVVVLMVVGAGILAACGGSEATTSAPEAATAAPDEGGQVTEGAALLEERCTVCHSLDRATQAQKTSNEWAQTVDRMIGHGALLDDGERAALIAYLAETYGPE